MSTTLFCPRKATLVDSLEYRSCHAVINFFATVVPYFLLGEMYRSLWIEGQELTFPWSATWKNCFCFALGVGVVAVKSLKHIPEWEANSGEKGRRIEGRQSKHRQNCISFCGNKCSRTLIGIDISLSGK